MWRLLLVAIAAASVVALYQPAQAQMCRSSASCYAEDDCGANPLCQDGPYDPCPGKVHWTFEFYRNTHDANGVSVGLGIIGTNVAQVYRDLDFSEGTFQSFSGDGQVTNPDSNTLRITRGTTDCGSFENLEGAATYIPGKPTGGDE